MTSEATQDSMPSAMVVGSGPAYATVVQRHRGDAGAGVLAFRLATIWRPAAAGLFSFKSMKHQGIP